jgi:pantoate--beta-alanine ligase
VTRLLRTVAEWRAVRAPLGQQGRSVGLVATMGALHAGHTSLCRRSVAENHLTVASVFVNPTQFNDPRDLAAYPRDLDRDLAALAAAGVDYCLAPDPAEIYADRYRFRVTERDVAAIMEGAFRPGHFDGVLTVVLRLFEIVRPTRAYFGEKDYQQYQLVRDMAAAFLLETEVVPCPTVREPDGLALSSRNVRLSPSARELAGRFARRLAGAGPAEAVRRDLEAMGIEVQYVEEHAGRRYAAVVVGGVRLIDNVAIA